MKSFSCQIREGIIHSIIGPNGAGKTTIFNLISGQLRPHSGSIRLRGQELVGKPPNVIASSGIGRTFQTLRLFKNLTVWENVFVAYKTKQGLSLWRMALASGRDDGRDTEADATISDILGLLQLNDRRRIMAKNLSYGDQRRLEIARALAVKPSVLLLDEPTCGMNPQEAKDMIATIDRIRARGSTIVLVEHNMRVVMSVSQHITVVDFGAVIAEGTPEEVKNSETVIQAYLGGRKC
ncbi:MAG: ABC transporter ATP-binding protein [Bacillota bacterium]